MWFCTEGVPTHRKSLSFTVFGADCVTRRRGQDPPYFVHIWRKTRPWVENERCKGRCRCSHTLFRPQYWRGQRRHLHGTLRHSIFPNATVTLGEQMLGMCLRCLLLTRACYTHGSIIVLNRFHIIQEKRWMPMALGPFLR